MENDGCNVKYFFFYFLILNDNESFWNIWLILAIFLLWIFECSLGGGGHGHSHNHGHADTKNADNNNIEHTATNDKDFSIVSIRTNKDKATNYLKAIQSNGWIAFFGDILHKTADGLAIGACN